MRSPRLRALLAVCVVALAACSSGSKAAKPPGTTTSSAATSLSWKRCAAGECATLKVPVDPALPTGQQIPLALARVPAGKPDQRIGSLLVNPGGPGAPGTQFVQAVESELPKSITDRFDIVGWDPRGTGSSSPVDCGKRLDYLFDVDTAPDSPTELAALEAASKRFTDTCVRRSGNLLRHISSNDTVRDLDRIRAALGDKKLTYAGFSYGTYLGALYAQAYPGRVRALLLDGAVDPAVPIDEVSTQQAKGFEASLGAFLQDCTRRTSCEFHHNGNPAGALASLRAKIDKTPMRGRGGRVLGPSQLDIALAAPLYSGTSGYRTLEKALAAADRGDPSGLLELFDGYMLRHPDGTYATEWPAFLAISCADGPDLGVAAVEALQVRAAAEAPIFGASNAGLSFPCSYWPFAPVNPAPAPVSAPGAPPIVVVGTTGDPATPVEWADGLARQLGARLVTVVGTTHTSSLDGIPCLDRAVTDYLVDLRPPMAGLRCGG